MLEVMGEVEVQSKDYTSRIDKLVRPRTAQLAFLFQKHMVVERDSDTPPGGRNMI